MSDAPSATSSSSVVVLPPADVEMEGALGAINNLNIQDPAPVPPVVEGPTEMQVVGRRLDELTAVLRDIQANAVHRNEFEGALQMASNRMGYIAGALANVGAQTANGSNPQGPVNAQGAMATGIGSAGSPPVQTHPDWEGAPSILTLTDSDIEGEVGDYPLHFYDLLGEDLLESLERSGNLRRYQQAWRAAVKAFEGFA